MPLTQPVLFTCHGHWARGRVQTGAGRVFQPFLWATVTSGSAATFAENATGTVYTAAATDPDAGTTLSYSLSGTDAALFNIDSSTGVVTFKSSPNFEAPANAGGDNVYDVTVTASENVTVTLTVSPTT